MERYSFNRDNLYNGCLLASIIHAIMMLKFPELSYEHSWDNCNYSINDGCGCKGTITFESNTDITLAAFQSADAFPIPYKSYLPSNETIIQIAENETLQYLLENINGKIYPVVTSMFWGEGQNIFGMDSMDAFVEKGGYLIGNHILPTLESLNNWKEYYEMTDEECKLAMDIFILKKDTSILILNDSLSNRLISLSQNGADDGLKESIISFNEINIYLNNQMM